MCNLSCSFCHVPMMPPASLSILHYNDFVKIIQKLPPIKKVKLQGMGEPFLNNSLESMVKYLSQKNISASINTNGTILNPTSITQVLSAGLDQLSFSLETFDRETYTNLRGKDYLSKVISNIESAVSIRKKLKVNTTIRIWSLLNAKNIHQLDDLILRSKKLGIDKLCLQLKLSCFGKEELRQKNLPLIIDSQTKEHASLLKQAQELAKKEVLDFKLYDGNQLTKSMHCPRLDRNVFISSKGEVVPCCIIGDAKIISMGNILKEHSFESIWNKKKYQDFRSQTKSKNPPLICRYCYE